MAMLPSIDSLWDYPNPVASEAKFREVLARPEVAAEPLYRLELLTQIGRATCLQRRYDETHALLDEVERDLPPTDDYLGRSRKVRVRLALERGRSFNDTGRHAEAKACFHAAWELTDHGRSNAGLAVDALHMLGVIDPPAEAAAWNEKAIEFVKGSGDADVKRWWGTLNNNLAWTYHKLDRFADALNLFRLQVHVFETEGRFERAEIARYGVNRSLRELGRLDEALPASLALLEKANAQNRPDGYLEEEVAECLLAAGRMDEARGHFARAYELLSVYPWFPPGEAERLERMKQLGGV